MKYIIDGYNVLHQIKELRGKSLRSQRDGFIRLLEDARARSAKLKDLTVVFDGCSGVLAARVDSLVKVVFSKGESADSKIKQLIESASFTRDIAVVSDDRQVRYYAGCARAKKVAVQDFLRLVSGTRIEESAHTFKLDSKEARQINQELEKIWLVK